MFFQHQEFGRWKPRSCDQTARPEYDALLSFRHRKFRLYFEFKAQSRSWRTWWFPSWGLIGPQHSRHRVPPDWCQRQTYQVCCGSFDLIELNIFSVTLTFCFLDDVSRFSARRFMNCAGGVMMKNVMFLQKILDYEPNVISIFLPMGVRGCCRC